MEQKYKYVEIICPHCKAGNWIFEKHLTYFVALRCEYCGGEMPVNKNLLENFKYHLTMARVDLNSLAGAVAACNNLAMLLGKDLLRLDTELEKIRVELESASQPLLQEDRPRAESEDHGQPESHLWPQPADQDPAAPNPDA